MKEQWKGWVFIQMLCIPIMSKDVILFRKLLDKHIVQRWWGMSLCLGRNHETIILERNCLPLPKFSLTNHGMTKDVVCSEENAPLSTCRVMDYRGAERFRYVKPINPLNPWCLPWIWGRKRVFGYGWVGPLLKQTMTSFTIYTRPA